MHLSSIYTKWFKWGVVYHTQPDSEEVEMVSEGVLFDTEKEAWDWFHANYRIHHFIQPEAVRFHIGTVQLSRQE